MSKKLGVFNGSRKQPETEALYRNYAPMGAPPGASFNWLDQNEPMTLGMSLKTPIEQDMLKRDMLFVMTNENARNYMRETLEMLGVEGNSSLYELISQDTPTEEQVAFFVDFALWLAGKPRPASDIMNTPWLRKANGSKRDTFEHVVPGEDVQKFLGALVDARHRFAMQLSILRDHFRGGLMQSYLYFKYIVRGNGGELDAATGRDPMVERWVGDLKTLDMVNRISSNELRNGNEVMVDLQDSYIQIKRNKVIVHIRAYMKAGENLRAAALELGEQTKKTEAELGAQGEEGEEGEQNTQEQTPPTTNAPKPVAFAPFKINFPTAKTAGTLPAPAPAPATNAETQQEQQEFMVAATAPEQAATAPPQTEELARAETVEKLREELDSLVSTLPVGVAEMVGAHATPIYARINELDAARVKDMNNLVEALNKEILGIKTYNAETAQRVERLIEQAGKYVDKTQITAALAQLGERATATEGRLAEMAEYGVNRTEFLNTQRNNEEAAERLKNELGLIKQMLNNTKPPPPPDEGAIRAVMNEYEKVLAGAREMPLKELERKYQELNKKASAFVTQDKLDATLRRYDTEQEERVGSVLESVKEIDAKYANKILAVERSIKANRTSDDNTTEQNRRSLDVLKGEIANLKSIKEEMLRDIASDKTRATTAAALLKKSIEDQIALLTSRIDELQKNAGMGVDYTTTTRADEDKRAAEQAIADLKKKTMNEIKALKALIEVTKATDQENMEAKLAEIKANMPREIMIYVEKSKEVIKLENGVERERYTNLLRQELTAIIDDKTRAVLYLDQRMVKVETLTQELSKKTASQESRLAQLESRGVRGGEDVEMVNISEEIKETTKDLTKQVLTLKSRVDTALSKNFATPDDVDYVRRQIANIELNMREATAVANKAASDTGNSALTLQTVQSRLMEIETTAGAVNNQVDLFTKQTGEDIGQLKSELTSLNGVIKTHADGVGEIRKKQKKTKGMIQGIEQTLTASIDQIKAQMHEITNTQGGFTAQFRLLEETRTELTRALTAINNNDFEKTKSIITQVSTSVKTIIDAQIRDGIVNIRAQFQATYVSVVTYETRMKAFDQRFSDIDKKIQNVIDITRKFVKKKDFARLATEVAGLSKAVQSVTETDKNKSGQILQVLDIFKDFVNAVIHDGVMTKEMADRLNGAYVRLGSTGNFTQNKFALTTAARRSMVSSKSTLMLRENMLSEMEDGSEVGVARAPANKRPRLETVELLDVRGGQLIPSGVSETNIVVTPAIRKPVSSLQPQHVAASMAQSAESVAAMEIMSETRPPPQPVPIPQAAPNPQFGGSFAAAAAASDAQSTAWNTATGAQSQQQKETSFFGGAYVTPETTPMYFSNRAAGQVLLSGKNEEINYDSARDGMYVYGEFYELPVFVAAINATVPFVLESKAGLFDLLDEDVTFKLMENLDIISNMSESAMLKKATVFSTQSSKVKIEEIVEEINTAKNENNEVKEAEAAKRLRNELRNQMENMSKGERIITDAEKDHMVDEYIRQEEAALAEAEKVAIDDNSEVVFDACVDYYEQMMADYGANMQTTDGNIYNQIVELLYNDVTTKSIKLVEETSADMKSMLSMIGHLRSVIQYAHVYLDFVPSDSPMLNAGLSKENLGEASGLILNWVQNAVMIYQTQFDDGEFNSAIEASQKTRETVQKVYEKQFDHVNQVLGSLRRKITREIDLMARIVYATQNPKTKEVYGMIQKAAFSISDSITEMSKVTLSAENEKSARQVFNQAARVGMNPKRALANLLAKKKGTSKIDDETLGRMIKQEAMARFRPGDKPGGRYSASAFASRFKSKRITQKAS